MGRQVASVAITTTGSAASATGSGSLALPAGDIDWIYIDYHASAPATTDVTIAYADTPPGGNILVRTDSATDGLFFPRSSAHTAAAAAVTNSYVPFPAGEPLTVSVAGSDALTACVTVYVAVK